MAHKRKRLCEEDNQTIEKEEQMKNIAPSLGEHILFDIFTRIPADTLHNKFKHQCRQWQHLITDEYFIKTNFSRSKPGIIFIERVIRKSHYRYLLQYMELDMKGSEVIQVRELHDFKTEISIISSCNDLILLKEDKSRLYHIMNPVTKKCIPFPLIDQYSWCHLMFIGEYKLVEMYHSKNYIPFLSIRTLDTCANTKHVEVPKTCRNNISYDGLSQVSVNGMLYWNSGKHIISFNLYNETFSRFQMPNGISTSHVHLMNICGSLSLIEDYRFSSSDGFNIWSMRDATGGGTWEKVATISKLGMRIGKEYYKPVTFVGASDHGNLLFFRDSRNKLSAYDVTAKRWSLVDDSKCPVNRKSVYYTHRSHVNNLYPSLNYLSSSYWKGMDDM